LKRMILMIVVVALMPLAALADGRHASTEVSPGGLTYHLLTLPKAKQVSIRVAWPTDWPYRQGVNKAVPYIGAKLVLSGGAKGYPAGKAIEKFADLKAGALLEPTADYVYGWLGAPSENINETVAIANAHLRAPLLDGKWFQRISMGLKGKFAQMQAAPATKAYAAVRWAVFGDQPIRESLSLEDLGMFDRADPANVARWAREIFTRSPDTIIVAGNISADKAGKAIDRLFDGLPEGGRKMERTARTNFSPRRILLHLPDAKTSQLVFVAPVPPIPDTSPADEFADVILVAALGQGDQSVLFKAMRSRLRASYAFGAGIGAYDYTHRFLAFSGQVETDKLAQAEEVARNAYQDFLAKGPEGDLKARVAPILANVRAGQNNPVRISASAMSGAIAGQDPGVALKVVDIVSTLTAASVDARLKSAFPQPDDFIVLATSPDENALPGACVITKPREAVRCK